MESEVVFEMHQQSIDTLIPRCNSFIGNGDSSAYENAKSSRPEVFYKTGVLKNFAPFKGKHLGQNLVFKFY